MEIWNDVPGFGGHYQASSLGRIRSKDRVVTKFSALAGQVVSQRYGGKVLKQSRGSKYGHAVVHIGIDSKRLNVHVARLVLMAFKGEPGDGMAACHNNGDPTDNRPENLRWDTQGNNNLDRKKHGRYAQGEEHPEAKITEMDAKNIASGSLGLSEAKTRLGISRTQFYRIKSGESWNYINQTHQQLEQ